MSSSTISAIIPVYNGARFLSAAIDSISVQQHPVHEIIVVDDGSTDETSRVAQGLGNRIKYIRQENQGPAAARNRGLQESHGEIIAFLDADDCWRPDKLEIQLPLLLKDDLRDAVWGMTQVLELVESDGGPDQFTESGAPRRIMPLGSFLFRRRLMEQLNGFDQRQKQSEDLDLIARALEANAMLFQHPETVLDYRHHGNNITKDGFQVKKEFMAAVKRMLDRKRSSIKTR